MLLGQRADSKQIKSGAERCIIEAHFDLSHYDLLPFFKENDIDYDAEDCILRRELTAAGKSRAFINDTPVALTAIKQLGQALLDIHSQHQNLMLREEDFQLSVVDIIAKDDKALAEYQNAFGEYTKAKKRLEQMQSDIERNAENEKYLDNEMVKHTRLSKQEYIRNVERSFKSNEFINIRFTDNDVKKMGVGADTYGIQIHQDYYSSSYADTGYLFLMVDLNDPDLPCIKVRTWQPKRDPNINSNFDKSDRYYGLIYGGNF